MPIWKHEHFEGGDVWLEGATADPDDEAAREKALPDRMRVTVRLFARLRDLAGTGELMRDVPPPATVADGMDGAGRRDARAARVRADDVRGGERRLRADAAAVRDGDEVAFLPPVSGG